MVTASGYGYTRSDGIVVIPAATLGPRGLRHQPIMAMAASHGASPSRKTTGVAFSHSSG